jgi:hypothetical protein
MRSFPVHLTTGLILREIKRPNAPGHVFGLPGRKKSVINITPVTCAVPIWPSGPAPLVLVEGRAVKPGAFRESEIRNRETNSNVCTR